MSWIRWAGARVGLDRAVGFAALGPLWQLVTGPITLVLIAAGMTPVAQGYYFTFQSLLALQSFVELGLSIVIVNIASHEWSRLSLEAGRRIGGDPDAKSRIISLGRMVFAWYFAAALVFAGVVTLLGIRFFSNDAAAAAIEWRGPWIAAVVCASGLLITLPMCALLEGCGQVTAVYQNRFAELVALTIGLWAGIGLGWNLWALALGNGMRFLVQLALIVVRYRAFFASFLSAPGNARISWRRDVWPMQWRLGLSGLVVYFAYSLFNPVIFRYHGAAAAGCMGLTLQALNTIANIGQAWMVSGVPRFGVWIARREFETLDREWFRSSCYSVAVVAAGCVGFLMLISSLILLGSRFSTRLLALDAASLFAIATVLLQISRCQSAYLRAHKQEPILALSIGSAIANGLLVWLMGRHGGALGAGLAYALVMAGTVVLETRILYRCRSEWHGTSTA